MRVRELVIGAAVGAAAACALASRGPGGARALTEVRGALRELADGHDRAWAGLARQVESAQRGQEEVLEFARSVLDEEALAAAGSAYRRRVVTVSVRAAEAGNVLRGLTGAFCDGIGMEVILQAEPGVGGRGPYLSWRPSDGRPLENVLAALLAAVPACGEHGAQARDMPGLDELRRLLLALHERGAGTVRIGPLVLGRTAHCLLGRVMSPKELAGLGPWDGKVPGRDGALDLTPWADGYRFSAA
jgi:hypothetical protein